MRCLLCTLHGSFHSIDLKCPRLRKVRTVIIIDIPGEITSANFSTSIDAGRPCMPIDVLLPHTYDLSEQCSLLKRTVLDGPAIALLLLLAGVGWTGIVRACIVFCFFLSRADGGSGDSELSDLRLGAIVNDTRYRS